MRLVDANVLLYAANIRAEHHATAQDWLDNALAGHETIGFAWVPLIAFVRISTHPGLFEHPWSVSDATTQVQDWLAAPDARIVHPGPLHAQHLERLLASVGVGGNMVNDAHLAALALENRAEIVSYDNDFDRFPGVRWRRPDDLVSG